MFDMGNLWIIFKSSLPISMATGTDFDGFGLGYWYGYGIPRYGNGFNTI